MELIDKSALVAELEKRRSRNSKNKLCLAAAFEDNYLLSFIDTLKIKEVDLEKEVYETTEAFAKIIRANLTGIDKDVQYKFEQLYKEITGKKMYQGYND